MTKKKYNLNENKEFLWICNTCRIPEETVEGTPDLKKLKLEHMPTLNPDFIQNHVKDFLILHYNCRSMMNKQEEIHNIIEKLKPSILCLTETWLDQSSSRTAFIPDGYKIIRRDRTDEFKQKYGKTNGGGIAVIYKEELKLRELKIKTETEETLWVEVKSKPNFILGTIYRARNHIQSKLYRPSK